MNKPHKHCELIKAWADGAEIQFFNHFTRSWEGLNEPTWSDETEYRIKPKTILYRAAIYKFTGGFATAAVNDAEQEQAIANAPCFIGWLTDWIEEEV